MSDEDRPERPSPPSPDMFAGAARAGGHRRPWEREHPDPWADADDDPLFDLADPLGWDRGVEPRWARALALLEKP